MTQLHNTTKLFYGKWTRKIVVITDYAGWVNLFVKPCNSGIMKKYYSDPGFNQVKEVAAFAATFQKSTLQLRGENNKVSIFFNDPDLKDQIVNKFTGRIKEIHEPVSSDILTVLTTPGRKRVVKKALFRRKFQFKINLKASASINEREAVTNWQKNNIEKTFAGDSFHQWGKKPLWFTAQNYFYIDNEKTLSMFLLVFGNTVKSIEEAVII